RAAVAEGFQELVSVLAAAELFTGQAAAGNDCLPAADAGAGLGGDGKAVPGTRERADAVAGDEPYPLSLPCETQRVRHGVCAVRERVDPAAVLLARQEPDAAEERERVRHGHVFQRGRGKARVLAVVVHDGRAGVRYIAAAVA